MNSVDYSLQAPGGPDAAGAQLSSGAQGAGVLPLRVPAPGRQISSSAHHRGPSTGAVATRVAPVFLGVAR